ncbi:hypothetical protein B9479_006713 [Cryptococcus floricola]|uniref:Uncharacterized protein n=1 Tax=Cryptococcus floricola TaxID=2591691 RepID=A0A5D3AP93_9TREE|nr:hypothetical protein B9479_006713 [Cryptococcus floricola]
MSLKSDDGADVPLPSIEDDTVDVNQPMSAADTEEEQIGPMDEDGWYPIERPGDMDTRFQSLDFNSRWRIKTSGSIDGIEGTIHFDIVREYDGFEEESWMAEVDDNVMKGEDSEDYYDNIKDAVEDTYWKTNIESQTQMENEIQESLRSFHRLMLAPPEWAAGYLGL